MKLLHLLLLGIAAWAVSIAVFALIAFLTGCSSNAVSTAAHIQAETAQISRIDTVIVKTTSETKDRIDSVIITRTDTVQVVKYYGVEKDKWMVRDSLVVRRDTLFLQKTDSIAVEKPVPAKKGVREHLKDAFMMLLAFALGVLIGGFVLRRLWQ